MSGSYRILVEDTQRANSACIKSDHSREALRCGLDVKPEAASRDGHKRKGNMRKTFVAKIMRLALVSGAMAACSSARWRAVRSRKNITVATVKPMTN